MTSMEQDVLEQLLDWVRTRYFGKYRGIVTDNADPDTRGRLKVRVPAVLDDNEVWAMPCVPYAGSGVGFYSLPDPGSGVWVEFEGGDPSFTIWTGCFWGAGELPAGSDPDVKVWKTRKFTLRIDDAADELRAEATSGSKVTISRDVVSESGGAKHTVGSSGVVSEKSAGKVEVTDASVRINSGALEVT